MEEVHVRTADELSTAVKTNIQLMLQDRINESEAVVKWSACDSICVIGTYRTTEQHISIILQNIEAVAQNFSITVIRKILEDCRSTIGDHIIIVSHSMVTAANQRSLISENAGLRFEFFEVSNFRTYLPDLDIVPPHRLLTAAEATACIQEYGSAQSFPVLFASDVIARWYDFPVGALVKIIEATNGGNFSETIVHVKENEGS